LKKQAIDEEKDRLEKKAANQVVAEEIRLEDKARKEVETARQNFATKEQELRKTVLAIEHAESDMEKRTAELV
jgi:flagellar hook-basal body complex protein FliE